MKLYVIFINALLVHNKMHIILVICEVDHMRIVRLITCGWTFILLQTVNIFSLDYDG